MLSSILELTLLGEFRHLHLRLYFKVSNLSTCNKHSDMYGYSFSTIKVQRALFPIRRGQLATLVACFIVWCENSNSLSALVYCVCGDNSFLRVFSLEDIYLLQYICLRVCVQRKTVTIYIYKITDSWHSLQTVSYNYWPCLDQHVYIEVAFAR